MPLYIHAVYIHAFIHYKNFPLWSNVIHNEISTFMKNGILMKNFYVSICYQRYRASVRLCLWKCTIQSISIMKWLWCFHHIANLVLFKATATNFAWNSHLAEVLLSCGHRKKYNQKQISGSSLHYTERLHNTNASFSMATCNTTRNFFGIIPWE